MPKRPATTAATIAPAAPAPGPGQWHGDRFYFGLHYDLHAGPTDTDLGKHLTAATLAKSLQRMRPDFVQTDCKGHPGMTSWLSRTPNATVSPGVVKDAMQIWRAATRQLGLPLHCHYSGIWDVAAAKKHPEWAVVPNPKEAADYRKKFPKAGPLTSEKMCPRGGYLHGLLIPQFIELVDRYGVDGFWVDGDMWGVEACYCQACRKEFTRRTKIRKPPLVTTDPNWPAWIRFQHASFDEYVTAYCNALHAHKPGVKICSNWMQTLKNPGPPTVPTDWISGDNTHNWGYDASRCEARFISTRGKPWDIMLWAFYCSHGFSNKNSPWQFKPPQMLMQEAAVSLALGGNIQVYENPGGLRDGRLADWRMDRLGEVSRFVKQRRAVCQNTVTIPQVVVLHSETHLYAQPVTNLHGGYDASPVQGAVFGLLENAYGVDILDEWALQTHLADFPIVVVPEQDHLADTMVAALKRYAEQGGRLLITGAAALQRFGPSFLGIRTAKRATDATFYVPASDGNSAQFSSDWALVQPGSARALGRLAASCLLGDKLTPHAAATVRTVGRGRVLFVPFNLFRDYKLNRYPLTRQFIGEMIAALNARLDIRVQAPVCVDVVLRAKHQQTQIHLINRLSGLPNNLDNGAIDAIPPTRPVTVQLTLKKRPRAVALALETSPLHWRYQPNKRKSSGGILTITVPQIQIHAAIVVDL